MPAKDFYHEIVKEALKSEGWIITHDPYFLYLGKRKGFIDLGAELIAAEKEKELIAVEIKSFVGLSDLDEFKEALGQYLIYQLALSKKEPGRMLFLAIPQSFYSEFFDDTFFMEILEVYQVKIIIFDEEQKLIKLWKS
ncbi:MAG: element excision factor XisH family protein [Microscillaceae bacterium]|nr:element excision factor XisH family protein [Microscillaceae bacterium]